MACPSNQTYPAAGQYPDINCVTLGTPSLPNEILGCKDNTPPPFPTDISALGWDSPGIYLGVFQPNGGAQNNLRFLPEDFMNQAVESDLAIKQGAGSGSYLAGKSSLKPSPFTINLYFLGDDPAVMNLNIHSAIEVLETAAYLRADFSTTYPNTSASITNIGFRELWGSGHNIKAIGEGSYLSPHSRNIWIQPITLMPKFARWTHVRTTTQTEYEAAYKLIVP